MGLIDVTFLVLWVIHMTHSTKNMDTKKDMS